MKHAAIATWIVAAGLLGAAGVHAQKYPERPIRLIVPFSPGGTSDLLGRVVGQRLADGLATTVVIDNRAGAGGTLGAALAAKAAPDGYTLLISHVGLAVNETLYSKKQYDALHDLAPISRIGETPGAVVVANALPARNMQELIAIWFAIYAPSGTPEAIIARLNQEIVEAMAEPDMREKLARTGVNPGSSTPQELGRRLRAEVAKWAKIIAAARIPIN
ncbi:MAG: hypothetical protein IT530_13565 [Burkholderiales bacterium]|nr:hypothetical protein [Burkholderiales bacterium]